MTDLSAVGPGPVSEPPIVDLPTIAHGQATFAVTQAWHDANSGPWPELDGFSKGLIDETRQDLLKVSNIRRLTDDEFAKLAALDAHFNVRNALDFLGGRPHTDFGFTGADQVHGQRLTADCGCELHFVFDHNQRDQPGLTLHPHTPRYVCKEHAALAADPLALSAKVQADAVAAQALQAASEVATAPATG